MSATPRIESPGATGAAVSISTADILRLVYESTQGDPLAGVDFNQFTRQQFKDLQDALLKRGETLTEEDKRAFERGDAQALRRLLVRSQERSRAAQHMQRPDGVTQSRVPVPAARPEVIPTESSQVLRTAAAPTVPDILRIVYQATDPDALGRIDLALLSAAQRQELEQLLLARGAPLTQGDIRALREGQPLPIEMLLRRLFDARPQPAPDRTDQDAKHRPSPTPARADVGFEKLKVRSPETDAQTLKDAARQLVQHISTDHVAKSVQRALGTKEVGRDAPVLGLRENFPAEGRSGQAHRLPALQFLRGAYLEVAQQLGIRSLVDLLARGMFPESRVLLARMLGIPTPTLLLALHRAELLDLPVPGSKLPHVKDALLLARLGAQSIDALRVLADFFDRHPTRLEVFTGLIELLQKTRPEFAGKQRMTRHDLRAWLHAARARGSDLKCATVKSADHAPAEVAGENVLQWHLQQRWQQPEHGWDELIARLLILMRQQRIPVPDDLWRALLVECGKERVVSYMAIFEREATDADMERYEAEMARYSEYIIQESEVSLLMELTPWLAPDPERQDRLICFWMDPVPDHRHVLGSSNEQPESLKPVYVCMDPDSGAIVPSA